MKKKQRRMCYEGKSVHVLKNCFILSKEVFCSKLLFKFFTIKVVSEGEFDLVEPIKGAHIWGSEYDSTINLEAGKDRLR